MPPLRSDLSPIQRVVACRTMTAVLSRLWKLLSTSYAICHRERPLASSVSPFFPPSLPSTTTTSCILPRTLLQRITNKLSVPTVVDAAARCPQDIVTCIFSCRLDTSHRDAHNKCIFGLIGRPLSSAAKHVTNPRPLRVLSHLRKNLAQL